jgi:type II restriction/modification system DNA methylase subunit YeeA
MPITVPQFVAKWKANVRPEEAAAKEQFLDICRLVDHPQPAESDPTGDFFTFEKRVDKVSGGKGFADVWMRDHFAWEYKSEGRDLNAAYQQLLQYREALGNPPLLVVSDLKSFQVHTNFDRTQKRIYSFNLNELQKNVVTVTCPLPPLEVLRALFFECDSLRPERTAARLTEDAARLFSRLAESIELDGADPRRGMDRRRVAHFLMKLLFCLFADSIGLLPDHLFRVMVELDRHKPDLFARKLRALFQNMATKGSVFGPFNIHWFNGGLFVEGEPDDGMLTLNNADMGILYDAAQLDWATIEPAIFGTLFERSLNAIKRSQIGAHYTSTADILLVVEPVVIAPLRAEWQAIRKEIEEISAQAEKLKGTAYNQQRQKMQTMLHGWLEKLASIRVLDPACGSGNFLYLALRRLLDLWLEAYVFAVDHGLAVFQARAVNPTQMFGIEIDFYAHGLASIVVWIGYLQWMKEHGMGWPEEPILRKLDNIRHGDAILKFGASVKASEPEWPEADFIIGNPPFLGGNMIRQELGDEYVDALFHQYEGRVPHFADLVCYWFEKARAALEAERASRIGLLATQGIRGGANRAVLERIQTSAQIFNAWSDKPWILDGAAVHVSIVCFENPANNGQEPAMLDGFPVHQIHSDLTSGVNTTTAAVLSENADVCFMGPSAKGDFDIDPTTARRMLTAPRNVNNRPNSDVVRPVASGVDLVQRNRGLWTVDFGADMSEDEAAKYELPFEYVRQHVFPKRQSTQRQEYRAHWWLYGRPRPLMREKIKHLNRYIATPATSKHRIFVWVQPEVLCNQGTLVFARSDDYFFGVLHSRPHEVWARAQGTQLREVESGFRYTPTSTFETFPFPWPPGREPQDSPLVEAIAKAARSLVEQRDRWLNPPSAAPEELARLTLTNLYNKRPKWLENAHRKLDEAVFAAYGWPVALSDEEILSRLLALNQARAAQSSDEAK